MQHFFYTCTRNFLPATFGGVAKFMLRKILQKEGKIIHFVSDKWIALSIKDSERDSRNAVDGNFNITGAEQTRPEVIGYLLFEIVISRLH